MKSNEDKAKLSFGLELLDVYGFPLTMFAFAIVPGLNFTFSGHGGISLLIIPLCAPWILFRLIVKTLRASATSRIWYFRFCKITLPSYVALALPLSWLAASALHFTYGLQVSPWMFFAEMVSPFPWWYFGYFGR